MSRVSNGPAAVTINLLGCLGCFVLSFQNLTDAIARAAADALQGPMQSAYRDAFQSVVLPAFEKSCQSMFQQINDTFKQGTQECKSGCPPLATFAFLSPWEHSLIYQTL